MPFEHPAFGRVRVVMDEATGEPWFVARDVAVAVGYTKPQNAIAEHCNYAKILKCPESRHLTTSPRGVTIIPESDVYRLIIRSNLRTARVFEKWVVEEVLPSIRKHGAYMTPDTLAQMLQNPARWPIS